MISWRMTAAWVAALVVATVLAWQIVGLADSQVGEPAQAVAPSLSTSTTVGTGSTSSPTPSTSVPTTSIDPSPTTTRPDAATTSSSSSSSSPTSPSPTSSTADTQWSLRTIATSGGVVVVRYRTGEVQLQAATPAPGFAVEIDDAGPPRVRVEFESDNTDVRVEARWDDGALDIDIDD